MRASATKDYRPACCTICCYHPQPCRALTCSVCESRPCTHSVFISLSTGPPQLDYMHPSKFFVFFHHYFILYYRIFIFQPFSAPLFFFFLPLLAPHYCANYLFHLFYFPFLRSVTAFIFYFCILVYIFGYYSKLYLYFYFCYLLFTLNCENYMYFYVKRLTGSYPKTPININQSISLSRCLPPSLSLSPSLAGELLALPVSVDVVRLSSCYFVASTNIFFTRQSKFLQKKWPQTALKLPA